MGSFLSAQTTNKYCIRFSQPVNLLKLRVSLRQSGWGGIPHEIFPHIYVPTVFKTGILGCSLSMSLFCKREFSLRNSPKVLQGEVSLRRLHLPRMSEGCSDHLRSHWEDMVVIYLPSHQEDVLAIYMVIRRMWGWGEAAFSTVKAPLSMKTWPAKLTLEAMGHLSPSTPEFLSVVASPAAFTVSGITLDILALRLHTDPHC